MQNTVIIHKATLFTDFLVQQWAKVKVLNPSESEYALTQQYRIDDNNKLIQR